MGRGFLFLKGTPEEMGRQQGELLKTELNDVMKRIVYGVGVGSSFSEGAVVLRGDRGGACAVSAVYFGSDLSRDRRDGGCGGGAPAGGAAGELFPGAVSLLGILDHRRCDRGGRMYHGRILDYLKAWASSRTLVVMIYQPDVGNAWANCGYAGFIGSVTAMNEEGDQHRRDGRARRRALGRQADGAVGARGDGAGEHAGSRRLRSCGRGRGLVLITM